MSERLPPVGSRYFVSQRSRAITRRLILYVSPINLARGGLMRRTLLLATIALTAHLQGVAGAHAQGWPTRPVSMVVPFAPGGSVDVMARILQGRLAEVLGQQVIVENTPGAGGMLGSARVAKAPPDGYEFVLGIAGTHAQNQTLYKNPLYHAPPDFAP